MTSPAPLPRHPSSVAAIVAAHAGADADLTERKYAAMRQSPFAFMRGTCHLFVESLPPAPEIAAPSAWLCGDLHVENFGTYKGDNRLTYFDVTDFDESALGPLTLDLIRFLASIQVGAEEWGVSAADADAVANRALVAYATELALGKPAWVERENARGMLKRLFGQVAGRSRTELLDRVSTRRGKRRRLLLDGTHLLPTSPEQYADVERVLATIAARAGDPEYFRVVDVARRIAGIGSITVPRYAVLVEGRGSPDRNVVLELKCAHPSALLSRDPLPQPSWTCEAERLVAIQRHAVVVAPAFLNAVCDEVPDLGASGAPRSYMVRELQLTDDRVRLKDWERQPKKLGDAMVVMASVAAWMHLRAAAWRGSATIEALSGFARETAWRDAVSTVASEAAARTILQYREFVQAYDSGALGAAS